MFRNPITSSNFFLNSLNFSTRVSINSLIFNVGEKECGRNQVEHSERSSYPIKEWNLLCVFFTNPIAPPIPSLHSILNLLCSAYFFFDSQDQLIFDRRLKCICGCDHPWLDQDQSKGSPTLTSTSSIGSLLINFSMFSFVF